jgi:DNA-binding PadR family transcriptional regulator
VPGAELDSLGRFSDPAMLILTSLSEGPKHGYLLVKDIERFSGSKIGPGTLYGTIARLEERGLIEALPAVDRRHPYRISADGLEVLRAHVARLERVVATGRARLGLLGA